MCSDIDTRCWPSRSRGVSAADARPVGPALRGTSCGGNAISSGEAELARLIEFRVFNLMSRDWSALGDPFDIVFCRNVMIYFDAATQRRVSGGIHRVPGPSLLYVGHSENFTDSRTSSRLRGKTIYERV